jgi:hypothetical protein
MQLSMKHIDRVMSPALASWNVILFSKCALCSAASSTNMHLATVADSVQNSDFGAKTTVTALRIQIF